MAVVGSSYGGYLAAILTSLRPVKWLALRVPALYKDADWELAKGQLKKHQDLDAYRRLPVLAEESRALRARSRLLCGFIRNSSMEHPQADSTLSFPFPPVRDRGFDFGPRA